MSSVCSVVACAPGRCLNWAGETPCATGAGDGEWHFNLGTKSSGISTDVWKLTVTLDDGREFSAFVAIR